MVNTDNKDNKRKIGFSTLTGLQRLVGIHGARVFDPEMTTDSKAEWIDNKYSNCDCMSKDEGEEIGDGIDNDCDGILDDFLTEPMKTKGKGDFPTSIDTIVFDFDGTLTDTWAGARPFINGYKEDLKIILQEERDAGNDFDMFWDKVGGCVYTCPERIVWRHKDRIVSSAAGDPYLMCNAIAEGIFSYLGIFYDSPNAKSRVMQALYADNYAKTLTVFKDGAAELLSDLAQRFNVCIATNSSPEHVKAKLKQLHAKESKQVEVDYSNIKIFGNARKYEISDEWQKFTCQENAQGITEVSVPEHRTIEGLDRPVLLRRKSYFGALEQIRSTYATSFRRMLVVGDNYELDLALPQMLGMAVAYVKMPRKLPYERNAVLNYERGVVVERLQDLQKVQRNV